MFNDRSVASLYSKKHIVKNIIYAQVCAFVTHEKGEMEIIRLQYAALNINKLKIIPLFRREQQKNDRKTSNWSHFQFIFMLLL